MTSYAHSAQPKETSPHTFVPQNVSLKVLSVPFNGLISVKLAFLLTYMEGIPPGRPSANISVKIAFSLLVHDFCNLKRMNFCRDVS